MKLRVISVISLGIAFIFIAYTDVIYNLMLLGTWGSSTKTSWWLYINFFLLISIISLRYITLKPYAILASIPIIGTILAKMLLNVFAGLYFTYFSNISINVIAGFILLSIFVFYINTSGVSKRIIIKAIAISVLALSPISHQLAYTIKSESTSNKKINLTNITVGKTSPLKYLQVI